MKSSIVYLFLSVSAVHSCANVTKSSLSKHFEEGALESNASSHASWNEYFWELYRKSPNHTTTGGFSDTKHKFLSNSQVKCLDDVKYIFRHLKSKWTIQMLDANGKVPSGALLGNFLWMGKYQECLDVHILANRSDSRPDINGVYCVATWNLTLPTSFHLPLHQLPVKTGLCLPESCSSLDITQDIKHIVIFLHRLPFLKDYGEFLNLNSLTCKEVFPKLSNSAWIFLYILCGYFVLIAVGSSVTIAAYFQSCSEKSSEYRWDKLHTQPNVSSDFVFEEEFQLHAPLVDSEIFISAQNSVIRNSFMLFVNGAFKRSVKVSLQFLKCFCLFTNAAKVLNTSTSVKGFPCIHGIRFFSMAWVILGHTYIHNINIFGNYVDLLRSIDNLPFQIISQGTFSVDSFFLISGFLLCYLFLEESDKRNGRINLFILCLHRFVRLTPVYMLLVAFNTLIFKYTSSGPFWGDDSDVPACKSYWWWNLLYINNFLPLESMCTTWTWYLANDMQFFLMGVLLLSILWRWPAVGLSVSVALLFCSWIVTWGISYYYHLTPLFVGISSATDYETYKEGLLRTWNLIYSKPYCRIGPYIIGMLLAYIMYRKNNRTCNLKPWLKCCGWLCASVCSLSVLFGVYHVEPNRTTLFHFYNALSRSAFSLGVSWVLYCCLSENADIINKMLSCKIWIPLGRLTYCAYLFHPLIMSWYFESQMMPLYFTHANMVMLYFSFLFVSFTAAFVISIAFETPVINLEKILRGKYS